MDPCTLPGVTSEHAKRLKRLLSSAQRAAALERQLLVSRRPCCMLQEMVAKKISPVMRLRVEVELIEECGVGFGWRNVTCNGISDLYPVSCFAPRHGANFFMGECMVIHLTKRKTILRISSSYLYHPAAPPCDHQASRCRIGAAACSRVL